MIVLAVLMMTAFHPGYCFPVLAKGQVAKYATVARKDMDDESLHMIPTNPNPYVSPAHSSNPHNTSYEPYREA